MHMIILSTLFILQCTAYVPQKTANRNKLFFGIEDSPAANSRSVGQLPPASSQIGVNMTATSNTDLNDYGPAGVPPEVLAARQLAASTPIPITFLAKSSSSSTKLLTIKHFLDVISVIWLIILIVGCFYFLRVALSQGDKPRITTTYFADKKPTNPIDREAYVCVDGG